MIPEHPVIHCLKIWVKNMEWLGYILNGFSQGRMLVFEVFLSVIMHPTRCISCKPPSFQYRIIKWLKFTSANQRLNELIFLFKEYYKSFSHLSSFLQSYSCWTTVQIFSSYALHSLEAMDVQTWGPSDTLTKSVKTSTC